MSVAYGFLLPSYCNFVTKMHRLRDIRPNTNTRTDKPSNKHDELQYLLSEVIIIIPLRSVE